ncbi:MAG: secretin and TonB N-terminal domain-containing protein [Candidatus Aureabacteria bacterium]|nr:secretin and TonB N-terminal domain-containing protein [Candidatus Auribacterota bacterium]
MGTERGGGVLCVCLLVIVLSAVSIAQEAPAPQATGTVTIAPPAQGEAVSPSGGEGAPPGVPSGAGRISVDFKDTDLQEILRTFSLRYGITIIAGPEVRGKVTMRLVEVPWEDALTQVVAACGYACRKEGNVWRVTPAAQEGKEAALAPAEMAAATVPLAPLPAETAGEAGPEPTAKATEEQPKLPGRVTFDFKDADIANILRIFSTRYGINIVSGPEVQGKVTIRLVDVPWETALKLILDSNNYAYVRQQNIIRVLPRSELDKEPLQTQVYPLSYARASEIVKSVEHLLTPGRGQIKPDERSNTLVVTDTPVKIDQIGQIITRLDKRTPQVLIEARIMELSDDFDENIGIDWVSLKGFNVTLGPPANEGMFSITREEVWGHERSHADVLNDLTTKSDKTGKTTLGSDSTSTTISTEPGKPSGTTITDTSTSTTTGDHSTDREQISGRSGIKNMSLPSGGNLGSQDQSLNQRGSRVMTTDLRQAVLTPDNFQLTLNFLQNQTDANLISHPKLVMADNKDGVIKVSEQWPIPKFQFNNNTGQWEISDFEYKDIGVILKVKPHVNEDEFINMKVVPEVSDILSFTTFGGATSAQLPVISTRTADTDVLIKNGQTLAIGGLMRENETNLIDKVPLFGEIPILGPYLFTSSTKTIRNSNLLIFITANVVTEENRDSLWLSQRADQAKQLNLPRMKWWQPKTLRHGLGSEAGY